MGLSAVRFIRAVDHKGDQAHLYTIVINERLDLRRAHPGYQPLGVCEIEEQGGRRNGKQPEYLFRLRIGDKKD